MRNLSVRLAVSTTLMLTLGFAAGAGPVSPGDLPQGMFGALLDGPPRLAQTRLDPSAYVETKVQKLANAQIVYVNWRAINGILKDLGYSKPPKHLTPEITRAILDSAGWAIPLEGESSHAYVEQFRKLYSIRYGGRWLYYNLGSGRNGAGGEVDFKGIGPTELVRGVTDGSHSNGVVNMWEAIKEAVWAGALSEELPYKANQVLFIIATGTTVDPKNPDAEMRTIIIRQDPVRPAYFQRNQSVDSEFTRADRRAWHVAGDQARMEKVLPRLLESLPGLTPKEIAANPAASLRKGLFNFVDRVAHQYATAYTRQVLLAAISTSNVEISGRAMDFGSTQALIGFPQARVSSSESPHGTTGTLKNDLVFEWVDDLKTELPPELAKVLPTHEELGARMDTQFAKRTRQGFLELAGSPRELSEKFESTREGRALAEIVQLIAQAGNDKIEEYKNGSIVARTGTYNLDRVLNAAVAILHGGDSAEFEKALPNTGLRDRLMRAYRAGFEQLLIEASSHGINEPALRKYMAIAVEARNRSMYGLRERWALWPAATVAAKKLKAGSVAAVQDFLDVTLESNIHEFKSGPFEIETSDRRSLKSGVIRRSIFNMKTGETRIETEALPSRRERTELKAETSKPTASPTRASGVRRLRQPLNCADIFG